MSRRGNSRLSDETESFFRGILEKHPERLREATVNTEFISDTRRLKFSSPPVEYKQPAQVRIVNGDTIDVAFQLQQEGLNPLVLNMASAYKPGGGWRKGSRAQEESLFYRSTYAVSLENCMDLDEKRSWSYPVPIFGAIYSPDVFVFRGNANQGYPVYPWEQCTWMNFVAVAALRKPRLTHNRRLKQKDVNIMMMKIESIFKIALLKGHDSVVLGALGCGAYGNPPEDIAMIFREAIDAYLPFFRRITFAILDDHNTKKRHNPRGNLRVFREVLSDLVEKTKKRIESLPDVPNEEKKSENSDHERQKS